MPANINANYVQAYPDDGYVATSSVDAAVATSATKSVQNINADHLSQRTYRDDTTFNSEIATADNPLKIGLTGKAGVDSTSVYPKVSPFKLVHIHLGKGANQPTMSDNGWDAWRTKSNYIPNNLYPRMDTTELQWSYSNEYEMSAATELSNIGIIKSVLAANTAIQNMGVNDSKITDESNLYISPFSKAPIWTGTSTLKMTNSIKLNFEIGQAGVYSGLTEVVLPIMLFAYHFAPGMAGGNGDPFTLQTSAWTKPRYTVELYKKILSYSTHGGGVGGTLAFAGEILKDTAILGASGIKTAAIGVFGKDASKDDALKDFQAAAEKTVGKHAKNFLNAINDTVSEGVSTIQNISIMYGDQTSGHFVLGPFLVKDVSWTFDLKNVDEYGWPTKGSITFGNLESLVTANRGLVSQQVR